MEFVIARFIQLPRLMGTGPRYRMDDSDRSQVIKEYHPVTKSYAERINSHFNQSGRVYDIDPEKSKQYNEALKAKAAERRQAKEAKEMTDVGALAQVVQKGLQSLSQEQKAPKPQNVGTPQPRKEGGNANQ